MGMKLSIKAFKKCKTKMWRNYGRALPYEKRYWQLKTIYPKCIKAERYWNLQRIKVWKIYKKPETCTSITENSTRLQETSASMFAATTKMKTTTSNCKDWRPIIRNARKTLGHW